ncbi:hypothetical protein [Hymenobacter crusticola]|uniref:Uncharacterized protein n=1 Tax=Hymenobacter crusticola TaxID=1770526 RepID=A0A243W6B4_9BACT|nr:hypothetical protein [Hymenobacter crusticola]OUJ69888.1 hypothetical protein BXP70_25835 [Hymenobacter crusticola]
MNADDLLSPGQKEAWRIAASVLKEFALDPVCVKQEGEIVYNTFLSRLAESQTIQEDVYTGSRILEKDVAENYVEWIIAKALEIKGEFSEELTLPIDFKRMNFNGSVYGEWYTDPERKLYKGGARTPSSTARAVLTLASGADLYIGEMNISYYVNSKIMQITGGNHRMMAYKLLGISTFPVGKLFNSSLANKNQSQLNRGSLTLYDDFPNEALNKALLWVESFYRMTDPQGPMPTLTVVGQETVILGLAAEYHSDSDGENFNELFRFTKHDLLDPRIEQNKRTDRGFINVLTNYLTVYQLFAQVKYSMGWFKLLFEKKKTIAQLTPIQAEIQGRWHVWRQSHSGSISRFG